MKLCNTLLVLILSFLYIHAKAQLPSDLSRAKASQISDSQLMQYINQAKSRNLTVDDVEVELLRRGLPRSEMDELKLRVQQLELSEPKVADTSRTESDNADRRVPKKNTRIRESLPKDDLFRNLPKLFGVELFENTNLSFEPDLRMPTPRDYTIGPDDELLLNIYGLNVSQQTLKVSPEGTVSVRYAGVVSVSGLSVEAAISLLQSRLTKFYPGLQTGKTKIQLTLGNIRSIRVILIGAVNRPGTYTLPSLASFYNALHVSGGPAENGSFRNIELIRDNKILLVADLYDFLVRGNQSANIRLQDNDVIRVPFAKMLVTVKGEINRPGIFEVKPSESLADVFEFAGSFKSKAFKGRITGNRYSDFDRGVIDVSGDSLKTFKPHNGDEYIIDSLINRYNNRVIVTGAVFKPGQYALDKGMTLQELIKKAQGLKEDVFAGSALVVRTRQDLSKEYLSVDLRSLLNAGMPDLIMQKEDSVHVASIFDLRDSAVVTINGAVRNPGIFRYEDSLSLRSLIIKAGGYKDEGTGTGIEISRRKRDILVNKSGSKIVELIHLDASKDLSQTTDITLQPFDIITIKEDPYYKKQISVKITGEVLMPAVYTLQSREERLSSIIQRSGGLLYTANIQGAKLLRQRKDKVDTSEVRRLLRTLKKDTSAGEDSTVARTVREVAIDLGFIIKHPGSLDDITLEEGDELVIPRINNTVSVNGEVFKPLDIMYEKGKKMRDYLSDAGGVTLSGKRTRAFVIYANGRSAKIRHIMGIFPRYPKITPGSNIFVPERPKRDGIDVAKAGIFISAITAMITAVALFTR